MNKQGKSIQAQSPTELLHDAHDALIAHMMDVIGHAPDEGIETDGGLYRYDTQKRGDKAGCYVAHQTEWGLCATFGDWRIGVKHEWNSFNVRSLNKNELAELKRIQAAGRAKAKVERHRAAQEQAYKMWDAETQTDDETLFHPYLKRKNVMGLGLKQTMNVLLIPIVDLDMVMHNLQIIHADGTKRFLSGGRKQGLFYPLTNDGALSHTRPNRTIICEGYATGVSWYQDHPDDVVLIAFDAGNLLHVAKAYKVRYIHADIVILADNDRKTEINTGLVAAKAAAGAIGATIIYPEFPDYAPKDHSDYNDWRNFYAPTNTDTDTTNGGAA